MSEATRSRHADRPFVVGVTGNIACGKSLVLDTLAGLGAETIDADEVYHRLIAPSSSLWRSLIGRFGQDVLDQDGRIDRRALGDIVFGDRRALADLDHLTHPAVVAEIRRMIAASSSPAVAVDAIKLIESGLAEACDRVWLVTCDPEQQIERITRRNGLSYEDAKRRVDAQPPLAPKIARADFIIDNSRTIEDAQEQVRRAWLALPISQRSERHLLNYSDH